VNISRRAPIVLSTPYQRGKSPDRIARVVLMAMKTAPVRRATIWESAAPNATIVRAASTSKLASGGWSAIHTKASSTAALENSAMT